MKKIFAEYIWLDGYSTQNIRCKTKVITPPTDVNTYDDPWNFPAWTFDGSSTKQAGEGFDFNGTDCVLRPVSVWKDPFRGDLHRLVFCEVFLPDGKNPHPSNTRFHLRKTIEQMEEIEKTRNDIFDPWFGWEQEYTMTSRVIPFSDKRALPLGFSTPESARPQGEYYCAVGGDNVVGRNIAEKHLELSVKCGLEISGINSEVLLGQWEFQVGPVNALDGADQLWISRYILHRVSEEYGVRISLDPKPLEGDWNGSGCHVNFSTSAMRKSDGMKFIEEACELLRDRHQAHITEYGEDNQRRLTGKHETSSMDAFSWGMSERSTSVRIPAQAIVDGRGYFEDRRPASNCDPYRVANMMISTVIVEKNV